MPCRITDETYINLKGKWAYYYRAIDKFGKIFDFMLSEHRNEAVAIMEGIEVAHMIRKRQFETSDQSAFQQFAALAG